MKTHELASLLESLAALLRSVPNRELKSVDRKLGIKLQRRSQAKPEVPRLEMLDKRELERFIVSNKLPVPFRKKDSTQELMRRIDRYLEENVTVKKKLRNSVVHTSSSTSPRLMQALSYLLQEKYE